MLLYSYFRSSAAYRVRIALNHKGIDYGQIAIHLSRAGGEHRSAEYLALNPQGLIPLLEDNGLRVPQSLAIMEYLEERFPNPPLLPAELAKRSTVRSIAYAIACDIHPLNNLRVLEYLRGPLRQPATAVTEWYQHWIYEGLRGLEAQAGASSACGRYLVGDSLTIADCCLVPQLFNARRFQCELSPFPHLTRISSHLETLPAVADAHPDRQPDAMH